MPKRARNSRATGLSDRQQVAAVCYRISGRGLEFLLVQTRGGRWIFPKGGVEPGLTQAQSAALEAFEEAGVHGRIEEMPFARYRHDKASRRLDKRGRSEARNAITAHLCEVSRLEPPQEADRKPTWFPPEKAKRRLLEDRASDFGMELARVVDRAVSRIQRLRTQGAPGSVTRQKDAIQQVRFEAFESPRWQDVARQAALFRHLLSNGGGSQTSNAARHPFARPRAAAHGEGGLSLIRSQLRLVSGPRSASDTRRLGER